MTIFNKKNQVLVNGKIIKKRFSNKVKAHIVLGIVLLSFTFYSFYKINQFFETHKFVFQSPITIHTQTPLYIAARIIQVVKAEYIVDEHISPLTSDQQYACDKFGKDCNTAIAIMRAESNSNHNAYNINKDESVDLGCFQINTIHLKNIDTTNINLLNCKDNIDVAYKIYSQQHNFSAWSAFNNGSYKKYLIN